MAKRTFKLGVRLPSELFFRMWPHLFFLHHAYEIRNRTVRLWNLPPRLFTAKTQPNAGLARGADCESIHNAW